MTALLGVIALGVVIGAVLLAAGITDEAHARRTPGRIRQPVPARPLPPPPTRLQVDMTLARAARRHRREGTPQ
ncbi:hypothetical protein [Streptomyces sp. NPDC018693]|uniref:hypothetical protein n=1 Tax=unclassified Streptomyces TaxID=2593676 RepID=UPI0037BB5C42